MNKIAEKINKLIDVAKDLGQEIKKGFKKFINIFKQIKWIDIPAATYVRWILAFVICLNTVLNHLGLNPISISENNVYQIVSAALGAAVLIVNTYKNNSTSKEAILSDKIMHALKDAETNDEEEMIGRLEGIIVELRKEDKIVRDHSNNNKIEDTLEPIEESSAEVVENTIDEKELVEDTTDEKISEEINNEQPDEELNEVSESDIDEEEFEFIDDSESNPVNSDDDNKH